MNKIYFEVIDMLNKRKPLRNKSLYRWAIDIHEIVQRIHNLPKNLQIFDNEGNFFVILGKEKKTRNNLKQSIIKINVDSKKIVSLKDNKVIKLSEGAITEPLGLIEEDGSIKTIISQEYLNNYYFLSKEIPNSNYIQLSISVIKAIVYRLTKYRRREFADPKDILYNYLDEDKFNDIVIKSRNPDINSLSNQQLEINKRIIEVNNKFDEMIDKLDYHLRISLGINDSMILVAKEEEGYLDELNRLTENTADILKDDQKKYILEIYKSKYNQYINSYNEKSKLIQSERQRYLIELEQMSSSISKNILNLYQSDLSDDVKHNILDEIYEHVFYDVEIMIREFIMHHSWNIIEIYKEADNNFLIIDIKDKDFRIEKFEELVKEGIIKI